MIWSIGNTTVRNPNRIREGLLAYYEHGIIPGLYKRSDTDSQIKLFDCLLDSGVIDSDEDNDDDKAFFARKWRLSFREMGLVSDGKTSSYLPGEITETGIRLINCKTESQIQNIFFRILYNLEYRKKGWNSKISKTFKPVSLLIKILYSLYKEKNSSKIDRDEFALIIQDYIEGKKISDYVLDIYELRNQKEKNKGKLKEFLFEKYKLSSSLNGVKPSTIKADYPDCTFRLLKLSGLFISKGRGIEINPQYIKLIEGLISDNYVYEMEIDYYNNLCGFPGIPIDEERELLIEIIKENTSVIKNKVYEYEGPDLSLDNEALELERVNQDDKIRELSEIDYYLNQRNKEDVIIKWFEKLINKEFNKGEYYEDEYLKLRSDERPQFLEWITWRAFLCINTLYNKPYESRQFRVDNDFLPIHHAPSRTPDLIFEFESFVLIVEVTLSSSSTQYSMEGEPVIRHFAETQEKYTNRDVYCLFLAPSISPNLAMLYKNQTKWFVKDEKEVTIKNVIPLSFEVFWGFFRQIPKASSENPFLIRKILNQCLESSKDGPKEWISSIEKSFQLAN